jgi:MFS family permease
MPTILKEKSESPLRWWVLFFTCVMLIANYYCYDIPAALHQQFKDYMGDSSDFETYFQLLYTVYSVPNVVLPFLGGYFVDKFGVRVCLIAFSSLLLLGQALFSWGVSSRSWTLMFIGRVVYGFGGENLAVANSAVLSVWFKGKELAFAFGLNLSIARLGSVANNFISPRIAAADSMAFASWFGVILTAIGVFSTVCISAVDKRQDKASASESGNGINKPLIGNEDDEEENTRNPVNISTVDDESLDASILQSFGAEASAPPAPEFRDVLKFSQAFWLLTISCVVVYGCVLPFNNIASTLLLERTYFEAPEASCALAFPFECESPANMPLPACSLYYASSTNQPPLPTNTTGTIDCSSYSNSDGTYGGCYSDYCTRLQSAEEDATATMSIPYFISAGLSPFLGAAVDRFGQRAIVAAVAPAILILVHLCLGLTTVNPIYPLVGQGLAYASFAAVLWPSVPLVIEQRFVGLGFGIVTSVQNMGLASFPLCVAAIYQANGNHYIPNVEMFFVSLATLGFLIGLYLNYYDYHHNNVFNSPGQSGAEALAATEGGRRLSADPDSRTVLFPGDFHAGERAARISRNSTDKQRNNVFGKVTPA